LEGHRLQRADAEELIAKEEPDHDDKGHNDERKDLRRSNAPHA
jgi:hypothetical protein